MAAFLVLSSIEKAAISIEIRSILTRIGALRPVFDSSYVNFGAAAGPQGVDFELEDGVVSECEALASTSGGGIQVRFANLEMKILQ